MVQICLEVLAPKFGAFGTAVCTREKTSSFFNLQSMLLVEENHAGASTSTHTDNRMLYTEGHRPRGCGGCAGPTDKDPFSFQSRRLSILLHTSLTGRPVRREAPVGLQKKTHAFLDTGVEQRDEE